jgi:hypothetical protein
MIENARTSSADRISGRGAAQLRDVETKAARVREVLRLVHPHQRCPDRRHLRRREAFSAQCAATSSALITQGALAAPL